MLITWIILFFTRSVLRTRLIYIISTDVFRAKRNCNATPSSAELDGPGEVAVAERVNEWKVQTKSASEKILVSYERRRRTAVWKEKEEEQTTELESDNM